MPGKEIRLTALFLSILVCTSTVPVFAITGLESEIGLGAEYGWEEVESVRGLEFADGRRGYSSVRLAEQTYDVGPLTDMLLDSGQSGLLDRAGRYRVIAEDAESTSANALRGESGLLFRTGSDGVSLESRAGALFHPGRVWDAFSIEFLMRPARMSDGDEILSWNGSFVVDGEVIPQTVRVYIERRRLVWEFTNLFILPDLEPFSIRLESTQPLTPGRVAHHQLRFDPGSGSVSFLTNGVPEDIVYATEDGNPGSTVHIPVAGSGSGRIRIGRAFSGVLDLFRIEEDYVTDVALSSYGAAPGVLISRPLDLGRDGSELVNVDVMSRQPEGTDIAIFYRTADSATSIDSVEWRSLNGGASDVDGVDGRFVQLRAELYTDGRREESAVLDSVRIRYLPSRPPAPPASIRTQAGDESVVIRWDHSPGDTVVGYDVFYGTRSGEYFGTEADQGSSPVSIGYENELELTGLRNGQMYFIAIVARDRADQRDGIFSGQVEVRPNP
ncbi:MAG: fibronectin type III domain-containing protein [Spirochaetaceae bacterium]